MGGVQVASVTTGSGALCGRGLIAPSVASQLPVSFYSARLELVISDPFG